MSLSYEQTAAIKEQLRNEINSLYEELAEPELNERDSDFIRGAIDAKKDALKQLEETI